MKKLITCIFILMLAGCSSSFNQVKQVDDQAYLQLSGDLTGATMYLDGQQIDIANSDSFKLDGAIVTKFAINSGTHLLEIKKQNSTVVKRKIYVTNGNVFEVNVP